MAQMGKYCKAYPAGLLRGYAGWKEDPIPTGSGEGPAGNAAADEEGVNDVLGDYLFIQENYTVTRGIFLDEEVVFDDVSEEWKNYCKDRLQFELPQ